MSAIGGGGPPRHCCPGGGGRPPADPGVGGSCRPRLLPAAEYRGSLATGRVQSWTGNFLSRPYEELRICRERRWSSGAREEGGIKRGSRGQLGRRLAALTRWRGWLRAAQQSALFLWLSPRNAAPPQAGPSSSDPPGHPSSVCVGGVGGWVGVGGGGRGRGPGGARRPRRPGPPAGPRGSGEKPHLKVGALRHLSQQVGKGAVGGASVVQVVCGEGQALHHAQHLQERD